MVAAKKKANKLRRNGKIFVASVLAYPLILFAVFWVGININSFLLAFQSIRIVFPDGKAVDWVLFDNFKLFINSLISSGDLISVSFVNSVIMYAVNLVICMPLYIIFSYLLYKKCFLNRTIRVIVMLPQIISGFVICLLFKKIVDVNGLVHSVFALFKGGATYINPLLNPKINFGVILFFMIWVSFSTSLIVYPNAMKEIPEEIIESAAIDGVRGMRQELRYIILPLIYPTLSTFLILGFAGILSATGPLVEFYYSSAPPEVYTMGYYYTHKTIFASATGAYASELAYPMLAAGGLLMTLAVAPLTHLLKALLNKFSPVSEY